MTGPDSGTGALRSGSWVADVCEPTLSVRAFLGTFEEVQRRHARKLGMHVTDMATLRLLDVHGAMTPTELARKLDLRSASVTVLLDRLEASGSIERVREHRDRRRVTVRALPEARERLFAAWAPLVRRIDDAGRDLSPADRRTVSAYLDRLTAIVTEGD